MYLAVSDGHSPPGHFPARMITPTYDKPRVRDARQSDGRTNMQES